MSKETHFSKIVLAICAILLIALTLLGKDTKKERFRYWDNLLTQIHLSSLELNGELLQMRAGFTDNYNDMMDLSRLLIELMQDANTYRTNVENSQLKNKKGGRFVRGRPSLTPDLSLLTDTMHRRVQTLKHYKIGFTALQNAQRKALFRVQELQASKFPDKHREFLVSRLPSLLYELKNVAENKFDASILNKLKALNVSAKDAEQKRILNALINQVMLVEQLAPHVANLVTQEIEQENIIHTEIKRIKNGLKIEYDTLLRTKNFYTYCSLLVACFITVYGVVQANTALRLSRLIQTQNKQLESEVSTRVQELANREAFFRAITETANDPIVLIDSANRISFCNMATTRLFGCNDADVLGETVNRLLPSISHRRQLLQSNFIETTGLTANNKTLVIKISASPFDLDDGRSFVACTMHDMTSFKQLEQNLAHSKKMESVGRLTAGMVHQINARAQNIAKNLFIVTNVVERLFELNNRLHAEKIMQSITLTSGAGNKRREISAALQESIEGVEKIADICNAMTSHIDSGNEVEAVDINKAVQNTIAVSRGEWKQHALLEACLADDLPLIECVLSDVNQVVLGMIVNAVYAIKESAKKKNFCRGTIRINTSLTGESVCIEISDNGIGISELMVEKIHAVFFTSNEVGKDSGRGLSIAHNLIVEKHGGRITLRSKLGEGTSFYITLPRQQLKRSEGMLSHLAIA